ncbi:Ca2+:H+ antiporter [Apiospora phragmitis]|uniref:Vacuolar calcium ion transporter n=1 Tax=Apiospora phragmitis TaxID=2905665 RepID=A0ABR1VCV0_9PEZI
MGGSGLAQKDHGDTYKFFLDIWHTPGMESDKPMVKLPAQLWHIIKATLLRTKINILLFCVPIGLVAGMTGMDPVAVFVINFFAIIPLAAVLSNATEDISAKLGEQLGGLLNATFGNAVELIVRDSKPRQACRILIWASCAGQRHCAQRKAVCGGQVFHDWLDPFQPSPGYGHVLLLRGLKNMKDEAGAGMEQEFTDITAQTTCSLLMLAAASMVVPSALSMVMQSSLNRNPDERQQTILNLSRGTAIILLIMYAFYLNFSLRTHHNLFVPKSKQQAQRSPGDEEQAEEEAPAAAEGDEEPLLGAWASGAVLIVTTVLVAVCADYLVDSIDALVERANISRNFIGLILIPIVGNAAEHVTAVIVAVKNNMDLAMQVAIGSSIQIAMFVTPFLVVLGWIMGHDMTMRFETSNPAVETIAFILAVLVVIYTVQDGKSNYLEGVMLMAMYVIIAVAFFAAPSDGLSNEDAGLDAFKAGIKSSIPS